MFEQCFLAHACIGEVRSPESGSAANCWSFVVRLGERHPPWAATELSVGTIDHVDTALWLPTTDITVMHDPKPVGDYKYYKYILVNTEDGEKAHAK